MMLDTPESQFILLICGFIIAFVLAFGIGANDVANSFGTSVGSKVLTLKQACILATIFEILGSILIGAKVSGTIRKGILDPTVFNGAEVELMIGYVSALIGCCVWLILATILNYPVSGTHSIVGATVGMAIVSRGIGVIQWKEIIKIVASWLISPILSGLVSLVTFMLIRRFILRAESPLKAGLKYLPLIYTVTIFVNVGGVVETSPPLLGFDKIPYWGKLIMVFSISILVYLGVWLIVVPYMKKKIEKSLATASLDELEQQKLAAQLDAAYYNEEGAAAAAAGLLGMDEDKHNASTQVDYVQLIVSRNEEAARHLDKAYAAEQLEHQQLQQPQTSKHTPIIRDYDVSGSQAGDGSHIQLHKLSSIDHSMHTVAADPHVEILEELNKRWKIDESRRFSSGNAFVGPGKKLVRMRTITAPTSASKEALDLSDVNLVNDSTSYYNNSYARKKYSLADNVGGSGVSCGGLFNDSIMSAQSNQSKKGRHPPPLLHRMSSTDQTLRGYLHTIHTPAMRAHLSQKQLSNRSAQTKDRQSITNSMGQQQHQPSSASNLRDSGNPFARLFAQQKGGVTAGAGAEAGQATVPATAPPAAPGDSTAAAVPAAAQAESTANEKRGRFNLVPASVSPNVASVPTKETAVDPASPKPLAASAVLTVPPIDEKAERKSMSDDEDMEQFLELPEKKEKEVVVDQYAHSDPPAAAKLFSFLQVLTAVFGSFAHGGNDVSNAIGPLIGLYLIYQDKRISSESATPEWILFYGGVGISVGLWILGRRVIKTIGEDLTKITASSGFVIELASAMTVLGASLINIPVSTTHCKVGSVVFTGRIRSKESVDWSLFRNIIIAWIVTVPVTGSIAAFSQFMLKLIFNIK